MPCFRNIEGLLTPLRAGFRNIEVLLSPRGAGYRGNTGAPNTLSKSAREVQQDGTLVSADLCQPYHAADAHLCVCRVKEPAGVPAGSGCKPRLWRMCVVATPGIRAIGCQQHSRAHANFPSALLTFRKADFRKICAANSPRGVISGNFGSLTAASVFRR